MQGKQRPPRIEIELQPIVHAQLEVEPDTPAEWSRSGEPSPPQHSVAIELQRVGAVGIEGGQ